MLHLFIPIHSFIFPSNGHASIPPSMHSSILPSYLHKVNYIGLFLLTFVVHTFIHAIIRLYIIQFLLGSFWTSLLATLLSNLCHSSLLPFCSSTLTPPSSSTLPTCSSIPWSQIQTWYQTNNCIQHQKFINRVIRQAQAGVDRRWSRAGC